MDHSKQPFINLKHASIVYAIYFRGGSTSPYDVKVDLSTTFTNRDEYLEFKKDWKRMYAATSKLIKGLRVMANLSAMTMPTSKNLGYFQYGQYVDPSVSLARALFLWRMQAKALLSALSRAKEIAGHQRNAQTKTCS